MDCRVKQRHAGLDPVPAMTKSLEGSEFE